MRRLANMVTDDERRRVAAALREYSGGRKAFHLGRLCAACGIDKSRLMSITTDADAEAWAHLADLIEPSCDRGALLALADKLECDGECDGCDMSDGRWCDAQGYAARRIREACGEGA